jgi:hypothetical protein
MMELTAPQFRTVPFSGRGRKPLSCQVDPKTATPAEITKIRTGTRWTASPEASRLRIRIRARSEFLGFPDESGTRKLKSLVTVYGPRSCLTCYHDPVENRTEPKTVAQWLRYIFVAVIALFLVWWMLRVYVL